MSDPIVLHKYHIFVGAALILLTAFLQSCSTCDMRSVSDTKKSAWTAEVRYKACGNYVGFSVAVYQGIENRPSYGQGDQEVFQAIGRREYLVKSQDMHQHVSVKWLEDDLLLIRHSTREGLEDDVSKLMVIRADKIFKKIKIIYEPEPFFWGR